MSRPRWQSAVPCAVRSARATRAAARACALALFVATAFACLAPSPAHACACGCGIFEVGTRSMFPVNTGTTLTLAYDFLDQTRNWSGRAEALAAANGDREIRTHFVTAMAQYTPNRTFSFEAEVPFWHRAITSAAEGGALATLGHGSLGDARVNATWTGLSADLSTGLSLGLKLPTGDDAFGRFDRDTQIGTGSTDLLLGAYHMRSLSDDGTWNVFAQASWEQPFATKGGYWPGAEAHAALGAYYHASARARLTPMLQLLGSARARDMGAEADPDNTGYSRLLLAPGAEARVGNVTLYADVEFRLYQWVRGTQLVAPRLVKFLVSYGR